MSLEELKAKVTKNIQYLHKCTDFASNKAKKAASDVSSVVFSVPDQSDTKIALAKHIATLDLGKLFKTFWQSLSGFITQINTDGYDSLRCLLAMYSNITDISDGVSKQMGEAGCLDVMIEALNIYRGEYTYTKSEPLWIMRIILLNAIQFCNKNIGVYRKANAISTFKSYLDCDDMETKVDSLIILAYIVDEEESSILQTTSDAVGFLLLLVTDAVSNEDHRTKKTQSSALELISGVNRLAVNDSNKREIARLGGIPVFAQMLRSEFSEEERCAAVQALLNMSFIEDLRISTELQQSIKGVEKLVMSNNQHLQQMATYALWQIKGQHLSKQTSGHTLDARQTPPSYAEALTQPTRSTKPKAQVMISYQWDNQETTKKLRDLLVQAGYQVWMDVTHMRGSLLDAMAKAVETSSLVLVCMSERYKNSENCRVEAQYAHTLKKPIVPLLLEPGYKPNGWLGIIGLTKRYYQVTSPEDLDSQMAEILAGIQSALGGSADVDGPIQPTRQEVTTQESSPSKTPVRQWSKDDVQEWLSDNDLSDLCEAFKRFKGKHLEKMYKDMRKNEDNFKQELANDYTMDGQTRTVFIVALEEAFKIR